MSKCCKKNNSVFVRLHPKMTTETNQFCKRFSSTNMSQKWFLKRFQLLSKLNLFDLSLIVSNHCLHQKWKTTLQRQFFENEKVPIRLFLLRGNENGYERGNCSFIRPILFFKCTNHLPCFASKLDLIHKLPFFFAFESIW